MSASVVDSNSKADAKSGTRRSRTALIVGSAVVAGLIIASLLVGQYNLGDGDFGREMFWISRVPRTAALVLAGAAMAVSGLIMQMITQNRFAEPTTTGTSEWAALGLLLAVIFIPTSSLVLKMLIATAAALIGTFIFMAILNRLVLRSSLVVPLVGMMLGAVVSACTTYIAASTNQLQMIGTWFQGSFAGVVRGRYEVLWIIAVIVVIAYIVADRFTVAGLGPDISTSVGLNYRATIFLGSTLVAVATGVTTVVVGFLPFLGLVVPNVVSLMRGDNLRSNLPWVCLGGSALVLACDILSRTIRQPFEIPVSLILGVLGSVVFIYLLVRQLRDD